MLDVVIDPDDIRMVHVGKQPRLSGEAIVSTLICDGEDFDGNVPFQVPVTTGKDQPKVASPQLIPQLIAGQCCGQLTTVDDHRLVKPHHEDTFQATGAILVWQAAFGI